MTLTTLLAICKNNNNVKPGTYENMVLTCIPGYIFSNNQLLQVEIVFDAIVMVWSVAYGWGLSYNNLMSEKSNLPYWS
jgi:hypothetical protein